MPAPSATRMASKINARIESGSYYEGLQLLQSAVARTAKGNFDGAFALLLPVLKSFAAHAEAENETKQVFAMILERAAAASWPAEAVPAITESLSVLPRSLFEVKEAEAPTDSDAERSFVQNRTLHLLEKKLLDQFSEDSTESCAIFGTLAEQYAAAGNYPAAHTFFLRSDRYEAHAACIRAWAAGAPASEADLFLARACLQALCFNKLYHANSLFEHTFSDADRPTTPLANFIQFLILTSEREAPAVFRALRTRYAPVLARDPAFEGYLDRIGTIYFGIKPANPNPLAGLMASMFGGGGGGMSPFGMPARA
mmetsp:Transcript_6806/g.21934  ORF Transcript_6806/g.21934 Transcript_6806/m.21934 type:complete len:312 (-) Transcript_6806:39-974(-)